MKTYRFAGVNFDHMHMGDLLRRVQDHPNAEIVGIADESAARMEEAAQGFGLPAERVFTDYRRCLEETRPDVVILCPATGRHAEWTEKVAPFGAHVLMEKPFAGSLAEADRMIAAVKKAGRQLLINWPLRWVAAHVTTKRLIDEGVIGQVIEVHFYDGNRGPLRHLADKVEVSEDDARRRLADSWFYKKSEGGGSMLDYLGYGVTLGTWFRNGEAPIEVTAVARPSDHFDIDDQSMTIARYARGLSKFETRWGTFTDPWITQPQPKCGFVIVGTAGTIASYDYEKTIRVQTREQPEGREVAVDELKAPGQNVIQYFINCLETGAPIEGPLSPEISRIGQQIVDSAIKSAAERRTVALVS
jgi:glucose-fructose oxidoreductase